MPIKTAYFAAAKSCNWFPNVPIQKDAVERCGDFPVSPLTRGSQIADGGARAGASIGPCDYSVGFRIGGRQRVEAGGRIGYHLRMASGHIQFIVQLSQRRHERFMGME
jgi:hypothetical protein